MNPGRLGDRWATRRTSAGLADKSPSVNRAWPRLLGPSGPLPAGPRFHRPFRIERVAPLLRRPPFNKQYRNDPTTVTCQESISSKVLSVPKVNVRVCAGSPDQRSPRRARGIGLAALFSPDRPSSDVVPWYMLRKQRCSALIWSDSRRLLASGIDVILAIRCYVPVLRLVVLLSWPDELLDPLALAGCRVVVSSTTATSASRPTSTSTPTRTRSRTSSPTRSG